MMCGELPLVLVLAAVLEFLSRLHSPSTTSSKDPCHGNGGFWASGRAATALCKTPSLITQGAV